MKNIFYRQRKRIGAYIMLFIFPFSVAMSVESYGAVKETISGIKESQESERLPESMSLFSDELTLKLSEDTGMIKPVFSPAGTEAATVFQSENEEIARVEEDGSVIPVSPGSTYICVSTEEGLTAYCDINIINDDESLNDEAINESEVANDNQEVLAYSELDEKETVQNQKPDFENEIKQVREYLQLARDYGIDSVVESASHKMSAQTAEDDDDKAKAKIAEDTEKNTADSDTLNPDIDTVLSAVRSYMLNHDTNPDYSSIWNIIGMTRSGLEVPDTYINTFYNNVYAYLESKNWEITRTKYSDYSKLIIGLTAIGIDAQNVGGHNLLAYLSDFTKVKLQGFNGPIWALMALKSHPSYQIPTNNSAKKQTTEEGLIEYLLSGEIPSGGWSLTGTAPDADITGMTIQALSFYYGVREDVTQAIDRAISWLSTSQLASGGYGTMGAETLESVAQIIVALSSISVDCGKDARFIKNGKWPMTGLFQYYMPEGGFMHVAAGAANNGGGEAGKLNGMATEQGMYATAAYKRLLDGKTSLYDMSDITLKKGEIPAAYESGNSSTSSTNKPATTTASKKIKVIKVALNYSQISVTKRKTRTLKATVTPANATSKKLKWTTSNKKIATVNSKGKVTGKKAGTAKITVTAQDGSKKKAVCIVKVKAVLTTSKAKTTVATTRSQTKTVTTARPVGTTISGTTSSSGATARAAGTGANGQTGAKAGGTNDDDTTEEAGWRFAGEDYVPEADNETEESTEDTKTDSGYEEDTGAIPYIMMGGGGCGIIWALWWLLRRKK